MCPHSAAAETQTCKDAGGRKDRLMLGMVVGMERHSEECDRNAEQRDSCICLLIKADVKTTFYQG